MGCGGSKGDGETKDQVTKPAKESEKMVSEDIDMAVSSEDKPSAQERRGAVRAESSEDAEEDDDEDEDE